MSVLSKANVTVGDNVTVVLVDGSVLKGMVVPLGITRGYAIQSVLSGAASWPFRQEHVQSIVKSD